MWFFMIQLFFRAAYFILLFVSYRQSRGGDVGAMSMPSPGAGLALPPGHNDSGYGMYFRDDIESPEEPSPWASAGVCVCCLGVSVCVCVCLCYARVLMPVLCFFTSQLGSRPSCLPAWTACSLPPLLVRCLPSRRLTQ